MRLEWCETNIWLYLSEDLLLAAVTEWAWHESHVQVYCRNRSRCHSDKLYRTYLNVCKEYCWCTSEMRQTHYIDWKAWLDTWII